MRILFVSLPTSQQAQLPRPLRPGGDLSTPGVLAAPYLEVLRRGAFHTGWLNHRVGHARHRRLNLLRFQPEVLAQCLLAGYYEMGCEFLDIAVLEEQGLGKRSQVAFQFLSHLEHHDRLHPEALERGGHPEVGLRNFGMAGQ